VYGLRMLESMYPKAVSALIVNMTDQNRKNKTRCFNDAVKLRSAALVVEAAKSTQKAAKSHKRKQK